MPELLSTGIDALDRHLGGGVQAGTIIALRAPPASRVDRVLPELASARQTLYLTTARSPAAIRVEFAQSGVDAGNCAVQRVDPDCPLTDTYQLIERVSGRSTIVVDPVDVLERTGATRLTEFLNTLRMHLDDTGSVGVLHCLDGRAVSRHRDVTEYMADGILSLTSESEASESRLLVPKFRGKPPVTDPIELVWDEEATVREAIV